MTQTVQAPPTTVPSRLRTLYVIRIVFSAIWVLLVLTTSASITASDKPTAIAAVLLIIYPLWDAVATFVERRMAGAGTTNRIGLVNIALGLVATIAMIFAVFNTVGTALLVFGIWALISGAIQLTVAIRRRHTIGAQWPMIVSGAISVVAGAAFASMSTHGSTGLAGIAGYSAFGAFWFLVSVIALSIRSRRAQR
jgi:uncharacterized membrane protein HdeD (DUF308 family)